MKKLIAFVLLVSAIIGLAGCEVLTPKTEFEKALDNMNALDSYAMEMTLNDVPLFGTLNASVKVQDGKTEMTFFGQTLYTFMEDDKTYMIYDFEGETYAFVTYEDDEIDELFSALEFDGFTEDDFTVNEDGEYVATESVSDMEELVIVIEEEYIVELRFQSNTEGATLNAVIEIQDLNEVEVTLPEYEVPNAVLTTFFYFSESGFSYDYEGTLDDIVSFSLTDFGRSIGHVAGEDYFTLYANNVECYYYPETQEWQVEVSEKISIESYLEDEESYWPSTTFEVLDDLYDYLNN